MIIVGSLDLKTILELRREYAIKCDDEDYHDSVKGELRAIDSILKDLDLTVADFICKYNTLAEQTEEDAYENIAYRRTIEEVLGIIEPKYAFGRNEDISVWYEEKSSFLIRSLDLTKIVSLKKQYIENSEWEEEFNSYNNGIADACSGVIDEREMDLDSFFAKYQKIVLENSDEIERSVEDDNYRGDLTDKNKREYTIGFNNTFVEVLELIKPEFVEAFQT